MGYARLWERLLEFLDAWSTAVQQERGRTVVTFSDAKGATRTIEIRMTPDEWYDMVTIPWGDFDRAAQEVRKAILGLPHHERFLVYGDYELVPSATATLPPDPVTEQLRELARQHPEGIGSWVALEQDGRVPDELRRQE